MVKNDMNMATITKLLKMTILVTIIWMEKSRSARRYRLNLRVYYLSYVVELGIDIGTLMNLNQSCVIHRTRKQVFDKYVP